MMASATKSSRDPRRWVKRLGWLGMVFSLLVNAGLFWALAFVNQRFRGAIQEEELSRFQVYLPPTEIQAPPPEEEIKDFTHKQELEPLDPQQPVAAPLPPSIRIPILQTDIVDLNAIPVAVSDVAVTQVVQSGPMELPDVDSAPRRTRGSLPPYPAWAQSKNLEGRVQVAFVVNPDGSVSDVRITRLEGDARFGTVAINAIQKWHFKPGLYRAQAVAVRCSKELVFRLQD